MRWKVDLGEGGGGVKVNMIKIHCKKSLIKIYLSRVIIAHAFNPGTQETEAGGVGGQPGLQS